MANVVVTENALAPGIHVIETIAGLRGWKSQGERSNIAKIERANRINQQATAIPNIMGFDCGEFTFDPWFTAWSQGAQGVSADGNRTAANVYNFSFWQYIDISYYYTHQLLTIPPTVWTNACHKNGVISLGTLNFNVSENVGKFTDADVIAFLTPKPPNPDPTKIYLEEGTEILKAIAVHFGFDGYLFNVEHSYPQVVDGMLKLLSNLKAAGCQTAWYDSPFSTGNYYDNKLTEKTWPFLENANYFQANYFWSATDGYPKDSWNVIAKEVPNSKLIERNNMFMSKDCSKDRQTPPYAEPSAFFQALDTIKSSDPPQYYTGLGLYYPAWDMYDMRENPTGKNTDKLPEREIFHANDQAFWAGTKDSIIFPKGKIVPTHGQCMRNYIEERSVITSLPFLTYFNDGEGDYYNIAGTTRSVGPWNNLSDQSILPTYRYMFNYPQSQKNKTAIVHHPDRNLVYSGGCCLSVDFDGQDSLTFKLFKTNISVPARNVTLSLIRKQTNVRFEFVDLYMNDGRKEQLRVTQVDKRPNGWEQVNFELPASFAGKTISDIGLQLMKGAPGDAAYFVGQFSFDISTLPTYTQKFEANLDELDWTDHYQEKSHYRIYGYLDGTYHLLGVVYNCVYRISYPNGQSTNIFNSNLTGFTKYQVQEVDRYGNASSLSP